jgi:hypothetical protein
MGAVVGIDGSNGSREALRWAADEAPTLRVLHAWSYHAVESHASHPVVIVPHPHSDGDA